MVMMIKMVTVAEMMTGEVVLMMMKVEAVMRDEVMMKMMTMPKWK